MHLAKELGLYPGFTEQRCSAIGIQIALVHGIKKLKPRAQFRMLSRYYTFNLVLRYAFAKFLARVSNVEIEHDSLNAAVARTWRPFVEIFGSRLIFGQAEIFLPRPYKLASHKSGASV